MALYLVSYDIREENRDEYHDLQTFLEQTGAVNILFSQWLIPGDIGISSLLYNRIVQMTKPNDRLLVQEVTKDAAWNRLRISDDEFRQILSKHARD